MQLGKTLLLNFENDFTVMSAVKAIIGQARGGKTQVEAKTLPAAAGSDYRLLLAPVLGRFAPTVVVLGVPQNARHSAEAVLGILRNQSRHISVMIVMEATGPEDVLAMLELGATDFAVPPLQAHDFLPRLQRLQPAVSERDSQAKQLKERLGLKQFIGESPALTAVLKLVPKLARCDASVFITGETGTGKEMFARALHYLSARASGPFIPVNCGAIPTDLVENELFGHEPGAFTGATTSARGLIGDADGGTLFLDEIDSLPLATQVKLLRFLQDRVYRPLGARKPCQADLRVICASNANLEAAARAGRFRGDLFYRINVLSLALPPLRERKEDIPLLARHFAAAGAANLAEPAKEFTPAALQKLMCYPWPGNVRELENIVQRAVVLTEDATIRPADIVLPGLANTLEKASFKALKARVIEDFERTYLAQLLVENDGNITQAAHAADKNRRAFWELLRKHHIQVPHSADTEPPEESGEDKLGLR